MSEATITKKESLVRKIVEKSESVASVVTVDYRGLTVEEVTNLHKQLREVGVEMKVVKSSILSRAARKVGLDGLGEVSTGSTAVTFSNNDVVAPAKIINEFAKDVKALKIKGSVIEGRVSSVEQITAPAKLSNREGLLSMLPSVLQAPVRNVAYAAKTAAEKNEEVA